jgi:hypothetical protein
VRNTVLDGVGEGSVLACPIWGAAAFATLAGGCGRALFGLKGRFFGGGGRGLLTAFLLQVEKVMKSQYSARRRRGERTYEDNETLLPLPLVPFERPSDRVEPIRRLLVGADGREGVGRSSDFNVISLCRSEQSSSVSKQKKEEEKEENVRLNSTLPRPSNDAQAVLLEL